MMREGGRAGAARAPVACKHVASTTGGARRMRCVSRVPARASLFPTPCWGADSVCCCRCCADGTFSADAGSTRRGGRGALTAVAMAAGAIAMVALVYANTSSAWPGSALMSEGQRTTQLAWGGYTNAMQDEADKAIRLCKVGLMGPGQHCAKHVVSTKYTKWTHSDAGQPTWEESQRVLSNQNSVIPHGPDIGTPGDFGDRR